MVSAINLLPNERSKVRALAGTEAARGAGGTPTFQLLGQFMVTETEPLIEREEFTGTMDPWVTPEKGPYDVAGTYEELLTFESLPTHLRYGMNGSTASTTPADDGNTVHGYTYTYDPCDAVSDIDSMVVEHGPPGLPETALGVMHKQFTISGDSDDAEGAWKWASQLYVMSNDYKASGAGAVGTLTATGGSTTTVVKTAAGYTIDALIGAYVFIRTGAAAGDVRKVTDNDATTLTVDPPFSAAVANTDTFEIGGQFTAGIAVPAYEKIKTAGTKLYVDDLGGTIGTTELKNKNISWSLTHALDMNPKRFMETTRGYSAKVGEGWRKVTGQFRIEYDDYVEMNKWKNAGGRLIKLSRDGTTIDTGAATKKNASIFLYAAYWNDVTRDSDRNGNLTRVYGVKGFYLASAGKVLRISAKNKLASLP